MGSPLSEQVTDFLSEKQRKKSRATADQYRFILERVFLPWAESAGLYEASDCTDKVMDRFQDHLLSRTRLLNGSAANSPTQPIGNLSATYRPLSPASVRTYVRGVRVFLNWANVPAGRFEAIGEPQRLRDPLSREEIRRVERTAKSERDRLIIRTLADTGLRISELLGLRLRDLREDTHKHRCYVRVIGKGDREREVGIPEDTFRRLRKFAAETSGEYIFQGRGGGRLTKNGAEQLVRRLARAAGITRRVHPHLFRHGFITGQIRAGKVDLVSLQKHVGHRTLAMISSIYSHVTADDSYDNMMAGLRG